MPRGWIIYILRVDRRSSESGRLRMKWKCDQYASPLIISPRPDTDTAPNWLQWGLNGGRGKCFSIFFIFSSCPEATWRLWSVCGLSRIDQEMIVNREPVSISSNSRDILENNWKVYKDHKVVSVHRLQREESNKPLPAAVFEKRELLLIASVKVDRFEYYRRSFQRGVNNNAITVWRRRQWLGESFLCNFFLSLVVACEGISLIKLISFSTSFVTWSVAGFW